MQLSLRNNDKRVLNGGIVYSCTQSVSGKVSVSVRDAECVTGQ